MQFFFLLKIIIKYCGNEKLKNATDNAIAEEDCVKMTPSRRPVE